MQSELGHHLSGVAKLVQDGAFLDPGFRPGPAEGVVKPRQAAHHHQCVFRGRGRVLDELGLVNPPEFAVPALDGAVRVSGGSRVGVVLLGRRLQGALVGKGGGAYT